MRGFLFSAFTACASLGLAAAGPATAQAQVVVRDHRGPEVRVRVAPPPIREERRVGAPSGRHVWVPGYWGWDHGRHAWYGGRWRLPPAPGRVWIEPRWENQGGEWIFTAGYWDEPRAVVPPGTVVVPSAPAPQPGYAPPVEEREWRVEVAPPPPRAEQPPPPPAPRSVWLSGYWGWNGHEHVWVPGHWEAARPGWVWMPGHWQRHGPRWFWKTGRWRHR